MCTHEQRVCVGVIHHVLSPAKKQELILRTRDISIGQNGLKLGMIISEDNTPLLIGVVAEVATYSYPSKKLPTAPIIQETDEQIALRSELTSLIESTIGPLPMAVLTYHLNYFKS